MGSLAKLTVLATTLVLSVQATTASSESIQLQVFVPVGSAHDTFPGQAHFVEHLKFLSESNHSYNEFEAIPGGSYNGWTSWLRSGYTFRFPEESLEQALRVAASLPEPLSLTDAEFKREKSVVKQEIWQGTRSNPDTIHYEEFEAKFYQDTIFAHLRAGQEEAVEAITPEIAKEWHKTHYEKNAMLVSIHGELDAPKTKKLAKAIFPDDSFTILVTDTRTHLAADPELKGFGPFIKPASFSPEPNLAFTMERMSDVQTAPVIQWSRLYGGMLIGSRIWRTRMF